MHAAGKQGDSSGLHTTEKEGTGSAHRTIILEKAGKNLPSFLSLLATLESY